MRRHHRGPGIHRRLLDPALRVARSPWLRSMAGGTGPTGTLRRAAENGCARLPVDSTVAQLRLAATIVSSPRVDLGAAWLLAATADADPLCRQPCAAHAKGAGADERQADRGAGGHNRPDRAADHRGDLGGRTEPAATRHPSPPPVS